MHGGSRTDLNDYRLTKTIVYTARPATHGDYKSDANPPSKSAITLCDLFTYDDAHDDATVCCMHAGLLGDRCLGRRCRVLLEYPGALCGGCVLPEVQKKLCSFYYICIMH